MTNLPVFGGNVSVATTADLVKDLQESVNTDASGQTGSYLQFNGKSGRYTVYGDDNAKPADTTFLINILGFADGYICWSNQKPIAKRLAALGEPRIVEPDSDELGPFADGDGWKPIKALVLRDMEGDLGQLSLELSSWGGRTAISELQRTVVARISAGEAAWPIVKLGDATSDTGGFKNFKPTFTAVEWLSDEDVQNVAAEPAAEVEDEPVEKPKATPTRRRG